MNRCIQRNIHTYIHTYTQAYGDITPTCTALFGTQRVPALSTSIRPLSETSAILTVTAPQLGTPGRVPIALTCRDGHVIDAYVTYRPLPRVQEVASDGPCTALLECALFIAVSDPPATIQLVDDIILTFYGASFLPRKGTSDASVRLQIISVSLDELLIRVQIPPLTSGGLLNGECAFVRIGMRTYLYTSHQPIRTCTSSCFFR
jgi:hypothetical protein